MRPWLVGLALALAGCATSAPIVTRTPPPPRDERPPRGSPTPRHVWLSGHWSWDEDKQLFFWETGRWAEARPGEIWIPGYWTRVEDGGTVQGWTWVEPRWEAAPR